MQFLPQRHAFWNGPQMIQATWREWYQFVIVRTFAISVWLQHTSSVNVPDITRLATMMPNARHQSNVLSDFQLWELPNTSQLHAWSSRKHYHTTNYLTQEKHISGALWGTGIWCDFREKRQNFVLFCFNFFEWARMSAWVPWARQRRVRHMISVEVARVSSVCDHTWKTELTAPHPAGIFNI